MIYPNHTGFIGIELQINNIELKLFGKFPVSWEMGINFSHNWIPLRKNSKEKTNVIPWI